MGQQEIASPTPVTGLTVLFQRQCLIHLLTTAGKDCERKSLLLFLTGHAQGRQDLSSAKTWRPYTRTPLWRGWGIRRVTLGQGPMPQWGREVS